MHCEPSSPPLPRAAAAPLLSPLPRALKLASVKTGASGRKDETTDVHNMLGGWFRNQVRARESG